VSSKFIEKYYLLKLEANKYNTYGANCFRQNYKLEHNKNLSVAKILNALE